MGTITGCTSHPHPSFTPQPFPTSHLTSPSIFRSLPSFFSALSSPNRSLTRLLAPTCHSNRLPPSLALSIRRFSLFSLYLVVLVPFLLSLSRPSFSPSSSCFVSSPPCLSPLWPSSFFSTSFSSSCEIHTHHMHGHYFGWNFCILVSSCLFFPSHHSCPFCSTTSPPPPPLSPSPLWFYIIFPFFFLHELAHARSSLITETNHNQTWKADLRRSTYQTLQNRTTASWNRWRQRQMYWWVIPKHKHIRFSPGAKLHSVKPPCLVY